MSLAKRPAPRDTHNRRRGEDVVATHQRLEQAVDAALLHGAKRQALAALARFLARLADLLALAPDNFGAPLPAVGAPDIGATINQGDFAFAESPLFIALGYSRCFATRYLQWADNSTPIARPPPMVWLDSLQAHVNGEAALGDLVD